MWFRFSNESGVKFGRYISEETFDRCVQKFVNAVVTPLNIKDMKIHNVE